MKTWLKSVKVIKIKKRQKKFNSYIQVQYWNLPFKAIVVSKKDDIIYKIEALKSDGRTTNIWFCLRHTYILGLDIRDALPIIFTLLYLESIFHIYMNVIIISCQKVKNQHVFNWHHAKFEIDRINPNYR